MQYAKERIKMIHRCQLRSMINRHENRNRERSRIYQIRQEMSKDDYTASIPNFDKN